MSSDTQIMIKVPSSEGLSKLEILNDTEDNSNSLMANIISATKRGDVPESGVFIHIVPKIDEKTRLYRILLEEEINRCLDVYRSKNYPRDHEITRYIDRIFAAQRLLKDVGFSERSVQLIKYMTQKLAYTEGIDVEIYYFHWSISKFCEELL